MAKGVKTGAAFVGTDKPTHVEGVNQGNSRGNYEAMVGHNLDASSTAARSTGIDVGASEPIDPSMPNLSPA